MFSYVRARPWITTVLWFNLKKQADWRIDTSPSARRALLDGAASLVRKRQGAAIGWSPGGRSALDRLEDLPEQRRAG